MKCLANNYLMTQLPPTYKIKDEFIKSILTDKALYEKHNDDISALLMPMRNQVGNTNKFVTGSTHCYKLLRH